MRCHLKSIQFKNMDEEIVEHDKLNESNLTGTTRYVDRIALLKLCMPMPISILFDG